MTTTTKISTGKAKSLAKREYYNDMMRRLHPDSPLPAPDRYPVNHPKKEKG